MGTSLPRCPPTHLRRSQLTNSPYIPQPSPPNGAHRVLCVIGGGPPGRGGAFTAGSHLLPRSEEGLALPSPPTGSSAHHLLAATSARSHMFTCSFIPSTVLRVCPLYGRHLSKCGVTKTCHPSGLSLSPGLGNGDPLHALARVPCSSWVTCQGSNSVKLQGPCLACPSLNPQCLG